MARTYAANTYVHTHTYTHTHTAEWYVLVQSNDKSQTSFELNISSVDPDGYPTTQLSRLLTKALGIAHIQTDSPDSSRDENFEFRDATSGHTASRRNSTRLRIDNGNYSPLSPLPLHRRPIVSASNGLYISTIFIHLCTHTRVYPNKHALCVRPRVVSHISDISIAARSLTKRNNCVSNSIFRRTTFRGKGAGGDFTSRSSTSICRVCPTGGEDTLRMHDKQRASDTTEGCIPLILAE